MMIGYVILTGLTICVFLISQKKIKHAQIQILDIEIQLEHKKKEVVSYALNFIQKNELIGEFSAKIKSLREQASPGSLNELNKINRLVNDNFRIDQDWENFKLTFEDVHRDFFIRLKEVYANISSAELKLCALVRLNLNLKESAPILGISPSSVKTARYRLRKKLGLSTEDSLVDFLILIDKKESKTVAGTKNSLMHQFLMDLQHYLTPAFPRLTSFF